MKLKRLVASPWGRLALVGAIFVAVVLFPEATRLTRGLLLLSAVAFWATLLAACWRTRARWPVSALPLLVLAPFALPARPAGTAELRQAYCAGLLLFRHSPYIWGGESLLGIDCSGLARTGLEVGLLRHGLRTGNGALTRAAADLWWHDCSARAMRDEYRGRTVRLFECDSINAAPLDQLQPGDMAVTSSGVHVLIYLGDREWIQADPGYARVVRMTVPSEDAWFAMPVVMVRWRVLS